MKRSTIVAGVGVVAVLAVGITAGVVLGMRGGEQTEASAFDGSVIRSTQTPPTIGPTPQPASIDAADRDAAEAAANDLLSTALPVIAEIDGSADDDPVAELSALAAQAFLSEIESERLEFAAEGWTREGSYSFDDVEALDYSAASAGATATVRVCLDGSALVTRRADGTTIDPGAASARVWNVFVLQQQPDSSWLIVGRTLPDDPAC